MTKLIPTMMLVFFLFVSAASAADNAKPDMAESVFYVA